MTTTAIPASEAESASLRFAVSATQPRVTEDRAPIRLLLTYEHKVSILVVSFNTRELLRQCLRSVLVECERLPAGSTAEILVVDNASNDGSPEMVEGEFAAASSSVRLIRSAINLGFAGANNLAMEQARGRYIVLLNSDALFHAGALRVAIQHMDGDTHAGWAARAW
jgi:GT2 family glycosyltransferase